MSVLKSEESLKLIRERQSTRTFFDKDRKIAKSEMRLILEAGSWGT